jgi:hypothetical protein
MSIISSNVMPSFRPRSSSPINIRNTFFSITCVLLFFTPHRRLWKLEMVTPVCAQWKKKRRSFGGAFGKRREHTSQKHKVDNPQVLRKAASSFVGILVTVLGR